MKWSKTLHESRISADGLGGTTFSTSFLPELGGGLLFGMLYNSNNVTPVVGGVLGDYNLNGVVDAADYTVWRNTLGQTGMGLPANGDNTGASAGRIDQADYAVWKAHFGMTAGSGAMAGLSGNVDASVPEPASWLLLIIAAIVMASTARFRRNVLDLAVYIGLAVSLSTPPEVGAALTGQCYNGWSIVNELIDFSGATHVSDREDPNLDAWDGSPYHTWRIVPGSGSNFGVEWEGFVRIDQSGQYGFGTISDDGSQVWIDDVPIVNNHELQWYDWEDNVSEGDTSGETFPPLVLNSGYHSIRVRWYEQYSYSGIELWWLLPNVGASDIPYYGTTFHGVAPTYNPNTNWAIVPASSLFTAIPALTGDYNGNGVVDAADYAIWRDTFGSTSDLRANGDDTGTSAGVIDAADYELWKSQFGILAGAGAATVPEPTSLVLLMLTCAGAMFWRTHAGRRWHLLAANTLALALPIGTARAAVTYDAAADFSVIENPHGVWRYGWYTSPTAEFQLYPTSADNGSLKGWYDPPITVLGAPAVFRNFTSEAYASGTVSILGGQLAFHPGNVGQYSVVRWIAPQSGMIEIAAAFTGRDLWGTTTDVHVRHNGVSLFDGTVNGFATGPAPFETTRDVLTGDIIDFTVGYGNGSFVNDTTSIEGMIVSDAELITGDYNGNGVVDAADYPVWRDTYSGPNVPASNLAADGDVDGDVDGHDYAVWTANFGRTAGGASNIPANLDADAAVPEPTSVALLVVGILMLLYGPTCGCPSHCLHYRSLA